MPMRKGLFVIGEPNRTLFNFFPGVKCCIITLGMSTLVYSGASSQSLEFYRALSFLRCLRHAKRVDRELYSYTDFANFQDTLGYFAKVSVAVYTRIRPWISISGMNTHEETAQHFLAISRLEGEAQRKAHGVLHRACKDIHRMVKDFDEDITDPQKWDVAAPRMVFLLVEVMGEKTFANMLHGTPPEGRSTPQSYGTVLETGMLPVFV